MIINKSELSLDEDETCKVITDHPPCSIQCSKKQPFDFWLLDKVNNSSIDCRKYKCH